MSYESEPTSAWNGKPGHFSTLASKPATSGSGSKMLNDPTPAARRFIEFFAATIRNKNTHMAYYQFDKLRDPGMCYPIWGRQHLTFEAHGSASLSIENNRMHYAFLNSPYLRSPSCLKR
jgi:hypothetical protein